MLFYLKLKKKNNNNLNNLNDGLMAIRLRFLQLPKSEPGSGLPLAKRNDKTNRYEF